MKKNKKGFTLVELLAVIVILGVLLMIAVPAIQNVINKSRRNSFESAAKLAIENVETIASTEKVNGTISTCYVPIITKVDENNNGYKYQTGTLYPKMTLERGSFGNDAIGYVLVNADGKGTITLQNSDYIVQGTLDSLSVESSTGTITDDKMQDTIKDNVCTWYYN